MEGTWFASIPMSPASPDMFTWTTSVEVKIACEGQALSLWRREGSRVHNELDAGEPWKALVCR
jgi:hypothetical protein